MLRRLTRWPVVLSVLMILSLTPITSGQLITSVEESGTGLSGDPPHFTGETFDHPVEGNDFTVPSLDEDVPFFVDRNHEYNGSSETNTIESLGLVGAEYVMVANDNKNVTDYILDTTVGQTVDVYYMHDHRIDEPPQWLGDEGWVFTGQVMGIDEGGDGVGPGQAINQRFWLWQQPNFGPGVLTTYEKALTGGNNMYGLVVTEPGVGPGIKEFPGGDFTPANFGLIDLGAEEGRPDFGALQDDLGDAQIGAAPHNTNNVELDPRTMTSGIGSGFTIAIDNLDENEEFTEAGLDWRDRGDSFLVDQLSLPLIQLGEDLVKNNDGVIRVTLSDLPAGPYEVTSYHIDPDFTQCEAIEIYVDVGDGYVDTGVLGDASLYNSGVGGLTPEIMLNAGATFSFEADGTHDVRILFDGRFAVDTEVPLAGLNIQFGSVTLPGDYNDNGELDAGDLDLQAEAIVGQMHPKEFDLNDDNLVNYADREVWVNDLKNTWIGDANLDLQFNSGDMVQVFVSGKYETGEDAGWEAGDWNGDMKFNSGDMVAAFVAGGYEQGAKPAAASAVPEPGSLGLMLIGLIGLIGLRGLIRRPGR